MQVCHTASKVLRHPLSLYRCDTKLQRDVFPRPLRARPAGGQLFFASRRQAESTEPPASQVRRASNRVPLRKERSASIVLFAFLAPDTMEEIVLAIGAVDFQPFVPHGLALA
jgi:hypothetical protein